MDWKEINSFDQVSIDFADTLVICDIDDTLLYFPELTYEKYNEILEYNKSIYTDYEFALSNSNDYWNKLFLEGTPSHTDMDGFARLLVRLHLSNGGLCFLTARPGHSTNVEFTKTNFNKINLNYDAFRVYYSWIKPKGEYIRDHIDISGYSNIIFIDDMDYNLSNVNLHFGSKIKNYKFNKKL
jgi:hypothetical protein